MGASRSSAVRPRSDLKHGFNKSPEAIPYRLAPRGNQRLETCEGSLITAHSRRVASVHPTFERIRFASSRSPRRRPSKQYGLPLFKYGKTLEIDHIVSLELGGSNDIANLFPEKADANPGYHVKDKLENKLHDLVCAGQLSLSSVRQQIASDWQALYKQVFGTAPTG